jgi:hypothetical protein
MMIRCTCGVCMALPPNYGTQADALLGMVFVDEATHVTPAMWSLWPEFLAQHMPPAGIGPGARTHPNTGMRSTRHGKRMMKSHFRKG